MELDEVGATIEPEPPRADPQAPLGPNPPPPFDPAVGPPMQHVAAARVLVVHVKHVEVSQGRATIAIKRGVQRRQGNQRIAFESLVRRHGTMPRLARSIASYANCRATLRARGLHATNDPYLRGPMICRFLRR